jgi:antitoxin component YwqK of YwqJK toxin-antitoxin module
VKGIVGCGETVDASKLVGIDGLKYEGDSKTPFTGVAVEKRANGTKWRERTFKNGELVSETKWDEEGNKR